MLTLAVPVYKCATYLERTLRSLNAQGEYVRWWLQDGGSTDGTVEIAERFRRPQDVVVSERDAGQTDALNRAMPQMGGDLIGFINGDDTLLPGAAQAVVEYFQAHPEVDLVYGEVEWIDADDRSEGVHRGRIDSLAEVLDIYRVWWGERQWVQPEVFFRRSLYERVGPFDTQYQLAFDYDYWVRCFLAGAQVARLPRVTTQFRRHAAQKSTAARQAADEIRHSVKRHLPAARLPRRLSARILAEITYDEYWLGCGDRSSFFAALLRHPQWLLAAAVRRRLQTSWQTRYGRAGKP